jgi:hypothetical protein
LDKAIYTLLSDPDKSTAITIFLQANESARKRSSTDSGISTLARDSGISRFYLTKEYNKAKEYLKQYIQNDKAYREKSRAIPVLD